LDKLRVEFPEIYDQLFQEGRNQYKTIIKAKRHTFKECMIEEMQKEEGGAANLLMRPEAII